MAQCPERHSGALWPRGPGMRWALGQHVVERVRSGSRVRQIVLEAQAFDDAGREVKPIILWHINRKPPLLSEYRIYAARPCLAE